jgi:hypothetical protein
MTCADIKDRTIDYLYGELSEGERSVFDQHLAGCTSCRAEVGALQGTLHQARAAVKLTDEAPPARVRVAVLEAARAAMASATPMAAATVPRKEAAKPKAEAAGGSFWSWLRGPWLMPLAGAAAAVTIFVLVREAVLPSAKVREMATTVEAPAPVAPAQPVAIEAEKGMAPAPPAEKAEAKPRSRAVVASAPSAAGDRDDRPTGNKAARPSRPAESRRYAPPPPERGKSGLLGAEEDEGAGSLSGALGPADKEMLERGRARAGAGAGVGQRGGARMEPAEKKQAESRGPARAAAKPAARPATPAPAPAPVMAAEPAPAAAPPPPPAKSVPRYDRQPAPEAAEPTEGLRAQMSDSREESVTVSRRAKAKKDSLSPFEEQVQKADRLFTAGRWSDAASAYRELLRLYPQHQGVAGWKGRLRACEQALLSK